jgi:uncharacterized protein (TIGR02266 family)
VANLIAAAVSLNVSTGGLAVRTTSPLEKDTALKVRFRLPGVGKEIDAECSVTWTDPRSGMGLRFTKIVPEDQKALGDFVRTHFFSNRKA